ncbi:unnamed protein product [Ixodes persulcatus]
MRAVVELRLRNNRIGRLLPGALDALDEASVAYVVLQENWLPCDCTLRSAAQVPLSSLPRCAPQHWTPVQAGNGAQRRPSQDSDPSGLGTTRALPSLFLVVLDAFLAAYSR